VASGKSTLAQLLVNHIHAKEPAVDPILVSSWPVDWTTPWYEKLEQNTYGYDRNGPNTIIFDNVHLTYWDNGLWDSFFKNIQDHNPHRVILFASYGNPDMRVSAQDTSMMISPWQNLSLRPVDHKTGPVGLLLTTEEFADMVERRHPTGYFEEGFLNYVFHVTAGHTPAVYELLREVSTHEVGLRIKLKHSLIIVSSHTVISTTGSIRWKSFRPNFLSSTSGRVSTIAVNSEVGFPCLRNSECRTWPEFFVQ
jgi:hypothetical protein